ncbi:MAG: Gfo/Idh/MocA family oxidoreductase [Chloroflexia bacterium]|nr:Gfo/Idh/MocA family oxidoreductase [Chloroflexia bacterium]
MLRIGIVGAGTRGRMYLRALRTVPDVAVAAVAENSPRAAEAIERDLAVPTYPSHEALFAGERLDAVVIATPDFAHRTPALDAARAGLHLLIEKPLANTVEDATAIRDAVHAAGVQCMVAFENRWNPAFVRARAAIDAGAVGNVLSQSAHLSNTYAVPLSMLSWSAQSSPGWFLMPHTVDLAIWLSGKRPARVYATGFRGELARRGVDTWDGIHALLTFEDGTSATLESLWVLPDSMPSVVDFKYRVIGSHAALYIDQQDQGLWSAGERLRFPGTTVLDVDGTPQGFPTWMAVSFARSLLAGAALSPGVEHGLLITHVVQAIHECLVDGSPRSLT